MEPAQFTIGLDWKDFPVKLGLVQFQIQSLAGPKFSGLSADDNLRVHWSETPDDSFVQAVKDYWSSISSTHKEAKDYVSSDHIKRKIKSIREGLVHKPWDNLSVAEKKLLVGITPTYAELGL